MPATDQTPANQTPAKGHAGTPRTYSGFASVVVPLDGTGAAEGAVSLALASSVPGAIIHLVRVIPSGNEGVSSELPAVVAGSDREPPEYALHGGRFTHDLAEAIDYLQAVVEHLGSGDREVVWEVRHGSPFNRALEAAHDHEVDAVILFQPMRNPWKRLIEPNLADFLAQRLSQPVVVCLASSGDGDR